MTDSNMNIVGKSTFLMPLGPAFMNPQNQPNQTWQDYQKPPTEKDAVAKRYAITILGGRELTPVELEIVRNTLGRSDAEIAADVQAVRRFMELNRMVNFQQASGEVSQDLNQE